MKNTNKLGIYTSPNFTEVGLEGTIKAIAKENQIGEPAIKSTISHVFNCLFGLILSFAIFSIRIKAERK